MVVDGGCVAMYIPVAHRIMSGARYRGEEYVVYSY